MVADVHQHVWPPPLIDALRARRAPPRLRDWTLELAREPDYDVDPADHEPERRAALARADGLDLALVSLSAPLGIEQLPASEARELLAAYHEGALALPAPFRAWAAAGVATIDAARLEADLARGFVGLQLPATALADRDGVERAAPLLGMLERHERPLFVHPGPATSRSGPAWWPAIVDYVGQMHSAWYAFRAFGRPRHPRLRVCFAMLAGLAPLHVERFHARTGERSVVDGAAFLETSSYGTRAIDAVVRVLGIDVLVNGSDRPYSEPPIPDLGEAVLVALRSVNPAHLIAPEEVSP